MNRQILALVFCLLFCFQSIQADEILFPNGDRLTGKIDHLLENPEKARRFGEYSKINRHVDVRTHV